MQQATLHTELFFPLLSHPHIPLPPILSIPYHVTPSPLHPCLPPDHCARCDLASNPCVLQVDCQFDRCGPVHAEPDGTPCDIPDSSGNTVKGTCQAGQCSYDSTRAAVNEAGRGSIWFPAGYPRPSLADSSTSVDPSITRSTPLEYLRTAMRVWDSAASQMQSCGDHNGGCGTAICTIGKLRRRRLCVQPRGMPRETILQPMRVPYDLQERVPMP